MQLRALFLALATALLAILPHSAAFGQVIAKQPPAAEKAGGGTREELDALINRVGKTPPDWFEATKLNYPATLDLSWPEGPPAGGWNSQKNVGQFVWDVVNPNPGRWKEGLRLMHHLLTLHKDDVEKRERVMMQIARMYHDFMEDYAHAAFWYRAVGVEKDPEEYSRSSVTLAECYWRLGFTTQALRLLEKVPDSLEKAKLLGDLGETEAGLAMALADAEDSPEDSYLCAGDICRQAARYDEALKHYQRVVRVPVPAKNPPGRLLRSRNRADANISAIESFEKFDPTKVADGKYLANSLGYEGAIEVSVSVRAGRIESVAITKHREKQFYSALTDTPAKIISKQSVKGVDATSHATITSEAIINATAKALAGKRK